MLPGFICASGLSLQPSRAESTAELTTSRIHSRRCQQMLHGATTMTVAVMIVPLHTIYPPVLGVASLTEAKAHTQFDLNPHMQSQLWADINAGIQQHLQKLDVQRALPWQIRMPILHFRMIPGTNPEPLKIAKTRQRAPSYVMERSATREYPSLIDSFFVKHTVNRVFTWDTWDEDRAIYEEMLRLKALGCNTESGVPYTDEEINALARKEMQRGHLPGLKKKNKYLTKQMNLMMKLFRSDDKFSQMLTQYESTPEFGSESGRCGDDEMVDDEDNDEDEEDEEDDDS
ncbi:hypothetical protein Tco_0991420 [Tanacetum coccineum]|uniref:Uncharacterized protein n=1 Tax=Tanacetum coccineum TaxID=301880 RepID=A0ABQ5EZ71_9ASTR